MSQPHRVVQKVRHRILRGLSAWRRPLLALAVVGGMVLGLTPLPGGALPSVHEMAPSVEGLVRVYEQVGVCFPSTLGGVIILRLVFYVDNPEDPTEGMVTVYFVGERYPFALHHVWDGNFTPPTSYGFVWVDADRDGTYDWGYRVSVDEEGKRWTPLGSSACDLARYLQEGGRGERR